MTKAAAKDRKDGREKERTSRARGGGWPGSQRPHEGAHEGVGRRRWWPPPRKHSPKPKSGPGACRQSFFPAVTREEPVPELARENPLGHARRIVARRVKRTWHPQVQGVSCQRGKRTLTIVKRSAFLLGVKGVVWMTPVPFLPGRPRRDVESGVARDSQVVDAPHSQGSANTTSKMTSANGKLRRERHVQRQDGKQEERKR